MKHFSGAGGRAYSAPEAPRGWYRFWNARQSIIALAVLVTRS